MSTNPFAGWKEKDVVAHNERVARAKKLPTDHELLTKTSEHYPVRITPAMMEGAFQERYNANMVEAIRKDIHKPKYAIPPFTDATPYFDLNKYDREVKSFSVPLTIIGAKRMTQADKSLRRPAIRAYMEFRNKLVELAGKYPVPDLLNFRCWIPMPESWSKKKTASMDGQPHRQKPDLDNCTKCLMDTLFEGNDSGVFGTEGQFKFWCRQGKQRIDVELVYLRERTNR